MAVADIVTCPIWATAATAVTPPARAVVLAVTLPPAVTVGLLPLTVAPSPGGARMVMTGPIAVAV